MDETIRYYNDHAEQYYWATVGVDLDALRKRFASYLPAEGSVIDVGCGSGRDAAAFSDMGFDATGLDLSVELIELARERLGVKTIIDDMSTWRSAEPYDGIWCCASLLHLDDQQKKQFFRNLKYNLKEGGIIYISVKDGIETGVDEEGRFNSNCTLPELTALLEGAGCEIIETVTTSDVLDRDRFKWLNIFARKNA